MFTYTKPLLAVLLLTVALFYFSSGTASAADTTFAQTSGGQNQNSIYREVPVTLNGGFEIGQNDYGRPVALIASMLGVTPDIFRQAFSGVTPAKIGAPSEAQAQANKSALLKVLSRYGVTNEKLDQVANYYRFNKRKGQTWPHTKAAAIAIVENGQITGVKITTPGSGYSSLPSVAISGFPNVKASASISYSTDFKTNGSISAITLAQSGN
ncbi:MAG: hypothetical protein ABI947_14030 [Chloroflexota bacterium]